MKNIIKYIGYLIFGLIIFIFFSYLNFPYHKIKDKLFAQVEKQSNFKIDVEEFKTTMLLGLRFGGVTIKDKRDGFPPIAISTLNIDPSLISLVTMKPKIAFNAELPQGSLNGFFVQKGATSHELNLEFDNLDLKKQFQEVLPADLNGTAEGQVSFDGNLQRFQGINGKTQIQIKKFILGKTSVMGMELPQLSLSQITLKGNMKKDQFIIEKFEAGNDKDDLKANISGDISINSLNIKNSRLNLKLKFKMSDTLKEEFKLFLPLLQGALDSSGNYSFSITGTFAAPSALPAKS